MKYLTLILIIFGYMHPPYAIGLDKASLGPIATPLEQCSKNRDGDVSAIEIAIGKIFNRYLVDENCVEYLRKLEFFRYGDQEYFKTVSADSDFRGKMHPISLGHAGLASINAITNANDSTRSSDPKYREAPTDKLKDHTILSGSK